MFRGLLAHPQEALHKQLLVYRVLVMSIGCIRITVEVLKWKFHFNPLSSITCSSSGGVPQAEVGVLHACYVSRHQDYSGSSTLILVPPNVHVYSCSHS
jgi:hypothetical protein